MTALCNACMSVWRTSAEETPEENVPVPVNPTVPTSQSEEQRLTLQKLLDSAHFRVLEGRLWIDTGAFFGEDRDTLIDMIRSVSQWAEMYSPSPSEPGVDYAHWMDETL